MASFFIPNYFLFTFKITENSKRRISRFPSLICSPLAVTVGRLLSSGLAELQP